MAGDDFYRVMEEQERSSLTPTEGVARYFDWERLRSEVLTPLRAGRPATYRRYDWGTNRLGDTVSVMARGIVLIEGIYVTRPELIDAFALAVVVLTSDATRRARVYARRENPPTWIRRWEAAEDLYFERCFATHRMWCAIDGTSG